MGLSLHDADVHADRGQQLADAVVQFAGDALAFFILHVLQTRGKLDLLLLRCQVGDQNSGGRFVAGQYTEGKIGGDQTAVGEYADAFRLRSIRSEPRAATSGNEA